jgi:hypothetical protein
MATYATVEDVANSYDGTIPADKLDWVGYRLNSAEVIVANKLGDIAAWIEAGKATADEIRLVLVSMVIRLLNNPKGIRTQSAGPFSYTLDRDNSSGKLFLSGEDRRLLGLSGAATVRVQDDALPYVVMKRGYEYPRDVQRP